MANESALETVSVQVAQVAGTQDHARVQKTHAGIGHQDKFETCLELCGQKIPERIPFMTFKRRLKPPGGLAPACR